MVFLRPGFSEEKKTKKEREKMYQKHTNDDIHSLSLSESEKKVMMTKVPERLNALENFEQRPEINDDEVVTDELLRDVLSA